MSRVSKLALPGYLFLCIALGGSTQAIWGNAFLQLGAIVIIACATLTRDPQPLSPPGRHLLLLVGLLALLFVIQLVPLPPSLWTALPGRDFVVRGYHLLGMRLPWLPISLAPYDTVASALTLLPPLALLIGLLRLRSWDASWMLLAVLIGTGVAICMGALQISGGQRWYPYRVTNLGVAVGTFANANHFATLVLVAIPMLAAVALLHRRAATKPQQKAFTTAIAVAGAALLAGGILISKSASILLLGPPTVVATGLMIVRLSKHRLRQGLVAVGLLVIIAAGAVSFAGSTLPSWGTSASIETRKQYWSTSLLAAEQQWLTGSGFGSFQQNYRRYEDASAIDRWYVNHAHNDYLEIAVEGGLPVLILVVLFLFWWSGRARDAWMAPSSTIEQKAAAVASAVILVHSAFDFPLRTAAIAGILAVCLALLSGARGTVKKSGSGEDRAVRHAIL